MANSQTMPKVTWAPWNPVSVKKVDPNRLVLISSPSILNWLNSTTWKPMKMDPKKAVASNHLVMPFWSFRLVAANAYTMAKLLHNSTKVLMVVMGMLIMSTG